jgi:hypothetical protein
MFRCFEVSSKTRPQKFTTERKRKSETEMKIFAWCDTTGETASALHCRHRLGHNRSLLSLFAALVSFCG